MTTMSEAVDDSFRDAVAIAKAVDDDNWEDFLILLNNCNLNATFLAAMHLITGLLKRIAIDEDMTEDEAWQFLRDAIEETDGND
jgi:hypothetical protein